MFQIGFGLGSDFGKPGGLVSSWEDMFRGLLATIDKVVYMLIKYAYVIFFNVASAEILKSQVIKLFYKRVELILGVIMIFKLSISLIQVIINPEMMSDQKKGFGKVISRILVMLAMFVAIMPLNIPNAEDHSYNAFLNQHGLLFGTMYSLQYRILDQNTIAKLILGNINDPYNNSQMTQSEKEDSQEAKGEALATYVLMTFIRPNEECPGNAKDVELWNGESGTTTNTELLTSNINNQCENKKDVYRFAYFPIISTICGALVLICLLSFCIDIAIRAIKLAILRLIAPIPIISYIDPKSSENGTFANWVKVLISTYIDLFVRLAIIYFIIFIVESIMSEGIDLPLAKGTITGVLATVFIIVGLFLFAKQAPKFIKDALGLKGSMSNIGLGSILAGAGALATKGTAYDAWDAARTAANAQIDAYNQGKAAPPLMSNFTAGRDLMAQNLTGNPKMTYAQMKRGLNFLANEGITDQMAEAKKGEMYQLDDEAEILKNLSDKINQHGYDYNTLNKSEKDILEKIYREKLNKLNKTDAYTKIDETTGQYKAALTSAQFDEIKTSGNKAFDLYLSRKTDAGKAKAEYQMIQKEQEAHGATPGYRVKYQSTRTVARWSDLTTQEGRAAVTSGGTWQTIRNVAGMTRNSVSQIPEGIREGYAEHVNHRTRRTTENNQEVVNSRNNNP